MVARCFARFVRLKVLTNRNKITVVTKAGQNGVGIA